MQQGCATAFLTSTAGGTGWLAPVSEASLSALGANDVKPSSNPQGRVGDVIRSITALATDKVRLDFRHECPSITMKPRLHVAATTSSTGVRVAGTRLELPQFAV